VHEFRQRRAERTFAINWGTRIANRNTVGFNRCGPSRSFVSRANRKGKRILRAGYATVFCAFVFSTFTCTVHADPLTEARITPQELKWEKLSTGVERANIAGDDKKTGLYVYRIRFPAGSRVTPHFHPDERVGTVLSGTLYFGYGPEFNEAAMKALPPGGSWTEPPKQPHFAWAKDGEVVIQVMGYGPSGTTQVGPK
jgi:quercetin dioxygenase-like cupin family protein